MSDDKPKNAFSLVWAYKKRAQSFSNYQVHRYLTISWFLCIHVSKLFLGGPGGGMGEGKRCLSNIYLFLIHFFLLPLCSTILYPLIA